MRRTLVLAAAVVAAAALAGAARADGDPASDYLLTQQVFLPYDVKLPTAKQRELVGTVAAANDAGYKIRVAVIAGPYDLGAITSLWGKPREYARFLGEEIQFVYKQRLLVVMPDGFGVSRTGHPLTADEAALAKVPIGKSPAAMLDAATTAVRTLAGRHGVHLAGGAGSTTAAAPKSTRTRDRLIILAAAVAVLLLALEARRLLRRRRR